MSHAKAVSEQLVRDIQSAMAAGDPATALKERLWGSCQEVVEALAARYSRGRPHLREDFLGEAYVKFERVLATFDPDRGVPFRAYLANCVEHLFHDHVRKRGERSVESQEQVASGGPDVLVGLRNREIAGRVVEVLDSLLPRDKQRQQKILAFKLRHFQEWPIEQIRAYLQVKNANTVSQWAHRVRVAFEREFPRRYPEYFSDLGNDVLLLDECGCS